MLNELSKMALIVAAIIGMSISTILFPLSEPYSLPLISKTQLVELEE